MASVRRLLTELIDNELQHPVMLHAESKEKTVDKQLIEYATNTTHMPWLN